MSRFLSIAFAVVVTLGLSATNSWGQDHQAGGCGCAAPTHSVAQAPVQSYQRFSYEPSAVSTSQMIARPITNVPMMVSQPQSYRRFSYTPTPSTQMRSNSSGSKQAWEYSKPDPRKYRH